MPIFEYRCKQCGERFERIVFGSPDQIVCPLCQSRETERQISSFAVSGSSSSTKKSPCNSGRFT